MNRRDPSLLRLSIPHAPFLSAWAGGANSLDRSHCRSIATLGVLEKFRAWYQSRISFHRVWKCWPNAPFPDPSLQTVQAADAVHVVFSPSYAYHIKFTKSASRGHPPPYCYELVTEDKVRPTPDDCATGQRSLQTFGLLIQSAAGSAWR